LDTKRTKDKNEVQTSVIQNVAGYSKPDKDVKDLCETPGIK
jgi:hypothetical protein